MATLDEVLAELEADEATKATAAKVREAAAAEMDTLRASSTSAAAAAKAAAKERDRLAADLAAANKDVDSRVTTATAERDAAKARAAELEAAIGRRDLESALADELGITNPAQRRRAVDAFLRDYSTDVQLVEGKLQGAKEPIARFRKAESFFFAGEAGDNEDKGVGSKGGDPPAAKPKPGAKLEGLAAVTAAKAQFETLYKRGA